MIRISVILTTFNSEKTLQRAIDSLLNQIGINIDFELEIIIVDDCSCDNTKSIIVANGLNYISTGANSGGPNKGRNIGLSIATGDYLCIMDHDDEWLPDKIISQINATELALIISTGYLEKNDKTGAVRIYSNKASDADGLLLYPENITFKDHFVRSKRGQKAYIGGLMFHNSYKKIKFEEKYSMVDFDWFLKLFHHQKSVEICKPLFIRHLSNSNLSFNETYRLNDYNFSLQTIENYRKIYPKLAKKANRSINGTMARYYYKIERPSESRKYFIKAGCTLKNLAYYATSFYGYQYINKRFKVF